MSKLTIPQALELAMRQRRAGNLTAAEAIYRRIIAVAPEHADAWHMLAVLAMEARRWKDALDLTDRSIQINPQQAGYHTNRAHVLAEMGRVDEAIGTYRYALSLDPMLVEANNNLGNLYRARGELDAAIACYRAVLSAGPQLAEVWMNLALALCDKRDFPAAVDAWERVIRLQPNDPDAWNNLGNALQEMGNFDPAIKAYQKALELRPHYPEAYNNMGNAYLKRGGVQQQAIEAFQKTVQQRPDYAEAFRGLGNALKAADRIDEAIAVHQQSLRLQPNNPEAHSDMGSTLHAAGRYEEAANSFKRAIEIQPDFAEGHFNLGLSLLLRGKLQEGWPGHEWRWRVKSHSASGITFPIPHWNGEPLAGKRILLYAEQGFGDTIMSVRFLPRVAEMGGKVNFICQRELARLLGQMPGIQRLIIPNNETLPDVDLQCSLMSLPMLFGITLENIPANVPYLRADPELIEQRRHLFQAEDKRLKVGLVWSGRSIPDPKRSMSLSELALLAKGRDVRFFSLQLGSAAKEPPPAGLALTDITADIGDFADTAALIYHLDLLITIDTAAAHLAGAMGKPTWVLLPWVPDWRWLLDRSDSPWYPTMRLFRQARMNDWQPPIAQVAEALAGMAR